MDFWRGVVAGVAPGGAAEGVARPLTGFALVLRLAGGRLGAGAAGFGTFWEDDGGRGAVKGWVGVLGCGSTRARRVATRDHPDRMPGRGPSTP